MAKEPTGSENIAPQPTETVVTEPTAVKDNVAPAPPPAPSASPTDLPAQPALAADIKPKKPPQSNINDKVEKPGISPKMDNSKSIEIDSLKDIFAAEIDKKIAKFAEDTDKSIFYAQNPELRTNKVLGAAFNGIVESIKLEEGSKHATLAIMQKASNVLNELKGTKPESPKSIRDIHNDPQIGSKFGHIDNLRGHALTDAFQRLSSQDRREFLSNHY